MRMNKLRRRIDLKRTEKEQTSWCGRLDDAHHLMKSYFHFISFQIQFEFCPEPSEFLGAHSGGRCRPRKPNWYTRIAFNCCHGMEVDMSACMPLCHLLLFTHTVLGRNEWMLHTQWARQKAHWRRHLHFIIIYVIVAMFFCFRLFRSCGSNEVETKQIGRECSKCSWPRMQKIIFCFRKFRMKELLWPIPACLHFYGIKEIVGPKQQSG